MREGELHSPPRLFENAYQCALRQDVARFACHRHPSGLLRMLVLPVISTACHEIPSVIAEHSQDFTYLITSHFSVFLAQRYKIFYLCTNISAYFLMTHDKMPQKALGELPHAEVEVWDLVSVHLCACVVAAVYPHRESNPNLLLRRRLFYPLNYRGGREAFILSPPRYRLSQAVRRRCDRASWPSPPLFGQ